LTGVNDVIVMQYCPFATRAEVAVKFEPLLKVMALLLVVKRV
jgi:hypothetical protein